MSIDITIQEMERPRFHPFITTFAILMGNFLHQFDKSLYRLFAPYIAFLFFPNLSDIQILSLAFLPVGSIFRPLGAWFMGLLGDRFGHIKALHVSLVGMALSTALFACLPTYTTIGIISPILLLFLTGMQSFFAAGESTGAPLVLLARVPSNRRNFMSSLYELSGISAPFCASGIIAIALYFDCALQMWRWVFFAGSLVGCLAIWIRKNIPLEEQKKVSTKLTRNDIFPLLKVAIATGFSYANYVIAMTVMTAILPKLGYISCAQAAGLHTFFLGADVLLLPIFGWLSHRYSKELVMKLALITILCTSLPLFLWIDIGGLTPIIVTRSILVLAGVAFAAPFQAWVIDTVGGENQYRIIAFGKAIGCQLFGAPTASISLWILHQTGSFPIIGLYVALLSGLTLFIFVRPIKNPNLQYNPKI